MLFNQPRSLFETIYLSPFGQSLSTQYHARIYHASLERSVAVAGDTGYGLVLLHLPIPHPPYFYKAATGRDDLNAEPIMGVVNKAQRGYLDALVLVDRTIGRLREAMERDGTWNSTSILFSADHPFRHRPALDGRPVVHNVPFLFKAAGQTQPVEYDKPFSALLTGKLIQAFLSRELTRFDQVPAWLDTHRADDPVE
jgi:arylsulfatase A-like enzyme